MYEIGEYIYTFFREEAVETSERVSSPCLYSGGRVVRGKEWNAYIAL